MWIYDIAPGVLLLACLVPFWLVAKLSYWLGSRLKARGSAWELPPSIPAGVQATLILILGFTYSMVIGRFEHRRQLVIDEANQISSAYQQSQALRTGRDEIGELLRRYLDSRIEYYENPPRGENSRMADASSREIEDLLWEHAYRLTRSERGAIENGFLFKLNEMSDLRLARNFALTKTMPYEIYLVIYLLCIASVAASNYARGAKAELGEWQPAVAIAVLALVFTLIVDIDQPTLGGIRISQDAMLAVRGELRAVGAAGKAPSLHRPSARGNSHD